MAVLSITITESSEQVVSGIPKTVTIATNIYANIYYTLDGTTPTPYSSNYIGPVYIPYNGALSVTLNVFAINGSSSATATETYTTDMVDGNVRLPHASTTAAAGSVIPDEYPFGDPPFQPNQQFLNPANSGVTVYNEALPAIANTYDGILADGYSGPNDGYTNQPYNVLNYQIQYSTSDREGQVGPNKSNVPADVVMMYPPAPQEQTNEFTTLFDPRAAVIFMDFSKADPNDPVQINRQFFSLEDANTARDGAYYSCRGQDATLPPSGSFIRAQYNADTGMMTSYYRDAWSNRWIIATSPYTPPADGFDGNLSAMPVGRNRHVLEWIPFKRQYLF